MKKATDKKTGKKVTLEQAVDAMLDGIVSIASKAVTLAKAYNGKEALTDNEFKKLWDDVACERVRAYLLANYKSTYLNKDGSETKTGNGSKLSTALRSYKSKFKSHLVADSRKKKSKNPFDALCSKCLKLDDEGLEVLLDLLEKEHTARLANK